MLDRHRQGLHHTATIQEIAMLTMKSTPVRSRLRLPSADQLTDAGIYILAFGGFYVVYWTLCDLALKAGFAPDQARVVAGLADLSIMVYSFKAIQEVHAGRSARGIRLVVAIMSVATFFLNIRSVWPDPTSVIMHALAPAVWIYGHEIMLRGKLRRARAAQRQRLIEQGLAPAPVARLRTSQWLLAPICTFRVWRMMHLWGSDHTTAVRYLVERWQADKRKPLPSAWAFVLQNSPQPEPVAVERVATAPELPPVPSEEVQKPVVTTLGRRFENLSEDEQAAFLAACGEVPPKGRTREEAGVFIRQVKSACTEFGVQYVNALPARLLGVTEPYVSRACKQSASA